MRNEVLYMDCYMFRKDYPRGFDFDDFARWIAENQRMLPPRPERPEYVPPEVDVQSPNGNGGPGDAQPQKQEKKRPNPVADAEKALRVEQRQAGHRGNRVVKAWFRETYKDTLTPEQIQAVIDKVFLPVPELLTVRDLMAKEFEPVNWLVPDLIPEGLTVLAGDAKIGKSFFCWNVAIAVATGGKALSKIDVPESQNVLFLALEDPAPLLQERVDALSPDLLPENLFILDDFPTLDEKGLGLLEELIDETQAKLVVIDTFKHVEPPRGMQGSAYDQEYGVLIPLQKFAAEKRIGLILVTHTNKSTDPDNAFNKITGSMGKQAGADTMLLLTKGAGYTLRIKGRRQPESEWALDLRDGGLWELIGDAEDFNKTQERQSVLRVIEEAGVDGMTAKELTDEARTSRTMIRRMKSAGDIQQPKARGPYYHRDVIFEEGQAVGVTSITSVTSGAPHNGTRGSSEVTGEVTREVTDDETSDLFGINL